MTSFIALILIQNPTYWNVRISHTQGESTIVDKYFSIAAGTYDLEVSVRDLYRCEVGSSSSENNFEVRGLKCLLEGRDGTHSLSAIALCRNDQSDYHIAPLAIRQGNDHVLLTLSCTTELNEKGGE